MPLRATVLIPTHNHEYTLAHAACSALAQTVREIEILIIGDGMSDGTRQAALELQRRDERVRLFDHPKGPRHGETYRHAALAEARGRIVCYLSDDDLWLPNHVETMETLLTGADFAHGLSVAVKADGSLDVGNKMHFGLAGMAELFVATEPKIGGCPLSLFAHTIDLYRRLPVGWDTTPRGIPTDRYMGRKLVGHPGCRAVTGTRPTALRFPSPIRSHLSAHERGTELAHWLARMSDDAWLAALPLIALDGLVLADAARHITLRQVKFRHIQMMKELRALRRRERQLEKTCARLQERLDRAFANQRRKPVIEETPR